MEIIFRVAEPSSTESSNAGDMFSPESPPPCKKPNLDFTGTFGKPTGEEFGGNQKMKQYKRKYRQQGILILRENK